ncbi:type IV secretion system protein VirB4 [Pseudomonas duriflava]|uniref:Type IV secretion system protein virB4 n=1 Tax=Pseudomonas duriflava TaxID=459528 RepID=A0A562PPA4_9PSED|nr:VirB4 family type IV secretion/conjugal transfer ATPase [Pseudomonas duriflava]TWI46163.1 type IV secretion system protein VirB4 [Pseudomonas duriflava]
MMELITYAIAALGAVMILVLYLNIYRVKREESLKKHRSTDAGLSDLLVHAAVVDDGVIVGKNGSLMAAWLYKGDDNASSTAHQREIVSARINQAFAGLGNGWMIHVDAVRRDAPKYIERGRSKFGDPLTEAIDEERRKLFESLDTMYEGYFVLTVTYFPPVLAQQKFVEMMFDDDAPKLDRKSRTHQIIETFKRDIRNMEGSLSSVLKMTRLNRSDIEQEDGRKLSYDDFLSWLQFCVTGIQQPVILPSNPMYLDCIIGGKEFFGGVIPRVGRNYIQVVAIEGFPLEGYPGILSALAEQPCEYRWSSRFIFMDTHEALRHLEKFRKKWRQQVRGFFEQVFNTNSGNINQDALSMVQDANDAIAEVNSGLIAQGYYTSVVVIMDEDRMRCEASARSIQKAIERIGFAARIETINSIDAYLGSIPGHGVENVRRPLINTMNLADLLPTSTIWTGSAEAPCPMYPPQSPPLMHCVTHGATPFRLNLHVRDLGHTFLFGPPGSGKSTLLAILAAQLRRYPEMSIFAFDKGMSLYPLTAGINATTEGRTGKHFMVAGDDEKLSFAPLQFLATKSDRAWAMEWIETILVLNKVEVDPERRKAIATAVMSLYRSSQEGKKNTTLSDFCYVCQDEQIRLTLQPYTVDGNMGHLLDATEDGLSLTDFTVFEIEELMNMGQKFALPVLLYLFRRIERSLRGQPAAIILDEAWLMLGHPEFREKIREWLKVLRKANCILILATQSLSDAANSGILDVLVEATATKIFLANPFARDEETSKLYTRMGLNARQIEIVATAVAKRHYYVTSENGRRLFDLALGACPMSLAFVGVSDKDSIAMIKNLERKYGYAWVDHWLESKRLQPLNLGVAA